MLPLKEQSGAWPMLSNRDGLRGWCMPILIHNLQYHYTELKVYEDGVVDCWEPLDLSLFREKLETGWIATSVPSGDTLGVFNFGAGKVRSFEPYHTLEDVAQWAFDAVRSYNPDLRALVDLEGEAVRRVGKGGIYKLRSRNAVHFRVTDAGEMVMAREVPVALKEGSLSRLTRWFVYADGMSRVGPHGPLETLEATEERVRSGDVAMSLPDGAWVELDGVGRAKFSWNDGYVDPEERIREQRDHLKQLCGEGGAIATCIAAWDAFRREPMPHRLDLLRQAYLAVPEHLRHFCGDMDSKDWPIRRALGIAGED